ncbi:TPA: hypothetical protein UMY98_000330 [Stenotrophomonas maltophilia]|nr:hypothetical protein [Stenotrophomonas maltophilia]
MNAAYEIKDLSEDLGQLTVNHMEKLSIALQTKDRKAWLQLQHRAPDESAKDRKNDDEFRSGLMQRDLRVVAWKAKSYEQPRWRIFKEYCLKPNPLVWVDIDLASEDGKHKDDIFVALGLSDSGELKECYYMPKE